MGLADDAVGCRQAEAPGKRPSDNRPGDGRLTAGRRNRLVVVFAFLAVRQGRSRNQQIGDADLDRERLRIGVDRVPAVVVPDGEVEGPGRRRRTAYDAGGAYWGAGSRLRVSYTKDLSYIHFYRIVATNSP